MYKVNMIEGSWKVIEKDTDLCVYESYDERESRNISRSLNLGSGFKGFTPLFFTSSFKQKERPSKD